MEVEVVGISCQGVDGYLKTIIACKFIESQTDFLSGLYACIA